MAQQMAKTVRVPMSKGLVTEATPLTFPAEATLDELNVGFEGTGARSKRKGFKIENGGTALAIPPLNDEATFSSFLWDFAGGDKDTTLLVLHTGSYLYFVDLRVSPLSSGLLGQQVNLIPFGVAGYSAFSNLSFAAIKGQLVVAGEGLSTIRVEYSSITGVISASPISFRIRDFEYFSDKQNLLKKGLAQPPVHRQYDTLNSGWPIEKVADFIGRYGGYPELTKPYYSTKDGNGWPSLHDWYKIEGGSTLITNGHYILDLYTMNRDNVSGVSGINRVAASKGFGPETTRFTSVASYAGRIFFAGMISKRSTSRIYFSQVIQDGFEFGDLYSINDPTAEYLSDLLDTDGGYINLPDAEGITHLHVMGTHLLVFATNGVWAITGADDVFRATSYSVNRISDAGLKNRGSFVSARGRPYWWSYFGIHTVAISEFKNLEEASITDKTIKTFYQKIPSLTRENTSGSYDEQNNQVVWTYGSDDELYRHRNMLVLDESAGAFAPWQLSSFEGDPFIASAFFNRHLPEEEVLENVLDLNGQRVLDSNGEEVVIAIRRRRSRTSALTYIVVDNSGQVFFAYVDDESFLDWHRNDYRAFLETGHNFMSDLSTSKNTPYVTVLCKRTETVWGEEEAPEKQSSLFVTAYWDFRSVPAFPAQQVYRIHRYIMPASIGQTFESEHSNVQTKIVPRGRGKALKLRFEGERGKDFHLIGFETQDAKNATP
jgi:hypothetical protein